MATHQGASAGPKSFRARSLGRCLGEADISRIPEVIIGAEVEQSPAIELHLAALFAAADFLGAVETFAVEGRKANLQP